MRLAHEFGHVEDAATRPAMTQAFQEYSEYAVKRAKELTSKNRINVKALDADITLVSETR